MIHNINQLKLSAENQQKLVGEARLLKQSSNIRFKILRVTKATVKIKVTQGYHISEEYESASVLEEAASTLFKDYVPGRELLIEAETYSPAENEMPTITIPYYDERMKAKAKRSKEFDDNLDQ